MRITCWVYASEFGGQSGYLLARGLRFLRFHSQTTLQQSCNFCNGRASVCALDSCKICIFCLKSYCPNLNMPQIIRKKDRSYKEDLKWRESAFTDFRLQVD